MPGSKKDRSNQGRYPCVVCSTQVTIHQKALQCDNCDEWTHFKCTPLTCDEYSNLAKSSKDWYCGNCESICGDIDAAEAVQRAEAAAVRRAEAAQRAEAEGVDEGNERVELSSGGEEEEEEEDVNGGSGDHDPDSLQMANPSEELLALLEDDFIKNLGNLVDVLKLKFEQIHSMQQRNKQLETENRTLRQQLTEKTEEVDILQQKLASQAEPQTEIRRLNGMVRGLRESLNSRLESQMSSGRQTDALTDRQGRMATVLGRMTNFLSGLSEDLTKTDTFMPVAQTPPSSVTNMANIPSRPSSADSHSTADNRPKNASDRRYGRRRRQLETSVASLLQKTERRLRQATKCSAQNCASGATKRSSSSGAACRSCHNPRCSRSPSRGTRRSQTSPRAQKGRHRNLPPKFLPDEAGNSALRIKKERQQTVALKTKPKPGDDDSTRCDVTIVTLVTDDSGNMRVVNQAAGTVEDRSGMTPDQAPYSPSNDVRRIVHTYIEQCSNPSDTPVDSSPWIHTPSNRASPRQQPFYSGFVHQFDGNEGLNDLNSGLTSGNLNITVTPVSDSPIDNVDSVARVSTPLEISTTVWNGASTSHAEEAETESEYHSMVGDSTVDYERNNSFGETTLKKRLPCASSHDSDFVTPGKSPLKFSPLKTTQTGRSSDVGFLMGAFSPVVRLDDISPRMTPNRFEPIHPSHHEVPPVRIKLKPKPQKMPSVEISPIKIPETLINSKSKPNIPNENATTVVITPLKVTVENGGHSRISNGRSEESSEESLPPLRRVQSPSLDQALPRTNVIVEVPMEIDACGEGLGSKSKRQHVDRFSDSDSSDSEISFPNSPKKIPSPAKKKAVEPKSSTPSKVLLSSITKKKYLKRKGSKAGLLSPKIVLMRPSSSPAVTVDSPIFSTPLLAQEMKRKPGRPSKKSKTPKNSSTPALKSLDVSKINSKLTPSASKTKVKSRKNVNGRKSVGNEESQNGGQKKRKRQSSSDDVKLKLIPIVKLVKFDD